MEPLAPGEVGEARPVPVAAPVGVQPSRPLPRDPRGFPPDGAPPTDAPPATAPPPGNPLSSLTGQLTIQVQPADAEVVVDGQSWPASPGQATLVLDLSEGRHVVQIRKPGYMGYLTEVEVRRGETTTLNVSLRYSAIADRVSQFPGAGYYGRSIATLARMTKLVVYMVGMVLLVGALAYGASLVGLSGNSIAVGAVALIGIGLMGAIVKTRQKDPS